MVNASIINEKDIKAKCGLTSTFSRGQTLFEIDGIYDMAMKIDTEESVVVSALAEGSYNNEYAVSFGLTVHQEQGEIGQCDCQCEAFRTYAGICKHLVAAMLEFNYQMEECSFADTVYGAESGDEILLTDDEDYEEYDEPYDYEEEFGMVFNDMLEMMAGRRLPLSDVKTSSGRTFTQSQPEVVTSGPLSDVMTTMMLRERNRFCIEYTQGDMELEVTLNLEYDSEALELRVGRKQMYVVKNIRDFVNRIKKQEFYKYGKNLEFVHTLSAFNKEAQSLIQVLMNVNFPEVYSYYGYYRQTNGARSLELDELELDSIIRLKEGKNIYVQTPLGYGKEYVSVVSGNPRLPLSIEGRNNGKYVRIQFPDILLLEGVNQLYVYWKSCIYICSEKYCDNMGEILKLMSRNWQRDERENRYYHGGKNQQTQELSQKDYIVFCSTLLPTLEKYMDVQISSIDFSKYQIEEGSFELYLDLIGKQDVICKATAKYGEKEHNLIYPAELKETYRDVRSEYEIRTLLNQYFPQKTPDGQAYFLQEDDDRLAALVRDGISQLENLAEVYASEEFKNIRITKNVKVTTGLSIKGNLLNVSWDLDGMSQEELLDVLDSYKRKKKYHRLKNGELLSLVDSGLEMLADMQEDLQLTKAQLKAGMADVPLYRALYVDALMHENAERIRVNRDEQFEKLTDKFDETKNKKYAIPENIQADLRNYQVKGYQWVSLLAELGFGGILADDMGLGKTLQMITYLSSDKRGTHLVICPASLVYNWEAEFHKFAPHMSVCIMAGNVAERQALIEHYKEYDVVITSYDLLKRDIELYNKKEFSCQIIDEAQYIKNPGTQAAKSVKAISSRIRFALTGTPIENRLSELWSIFEYLMPGYLYSYKHFKEHFEEHIIQQAEVEKGDTETENKALARLHTMIQPFLMRRLKKDVLQELPDKMEEVIYSKFSKEQEKLYKATEKNLVASLRSKSNEEFRENKLQVLAEITKLRQICCDPALLYDNYKDGSAKLDTCMELIESAIESGHRILLFSQFTSMLEVLAARLKERQIRYFMLTGSTSKMKRRNLVERFQEKEAEVFLISLKAGGTGLNLTAADMVIHYDPWWNVAAQNQATDRAHRIGQNNTVTVMKLIAKNTIEERILKLQEKKKELADMIISEGGVDLSAMTKEDLLGLFEEV